MVAMAAPGAGLASAANHDTNRVVPVLISEVLVSELLISECLSPIAYVSCAYAGCVVLRHTGITGIIEIFYLFADPRNERERRGVP